MKFLEPATVLELLNWRYATKQFDPTKTIPASTWNAIEDALVLTPSSYGLQPWKFFVITNAELKAALQEHSWNQPQVTDCSHYVILAAKLDLNVAYIEKYIARIAEVRGVTTESMLFFQEMMARDLINGPRAEVVKEWAARQAYIALGNLLTTAALLGVDACPMEGLDPVKYDEILDLPAKGFRTAVACALGYRLDEDKYSSLAKVRFAKSEMIQSL